MSQYPQHRAKHFTCRKAAVFSDIHSNYHAFKACYEDALLDENLWRSIATEMGMQFTEREILALLADEPSLSHQR